MSKSLEEMVYKFDPSQPRDDSGQWVGNMAGELNKIAVNDLMNIRDELRNDVLDGTHSLQDVIDGKVKVGVEGGGGAEIIEARQRGLYTTKVGRIPIYARTKEDADPLVKYLENGGKYGSLEFSRLLGYTNAQIKRYSQFIDVQAELARRGIGASIKTIHQKARATYASRFNKLARALYRGGISSFEFTDNLFTVMRQNFLTAWQEGRDSVKAGPMTDDDKLRVQDIVMEQATYAPGFAEFVRGVAEAGKPFSAVEPRMEIWVNKYDEVIAEAQASARGEQRLRWVYDPLKEHCEDCAALNGRVYTAAVWQKYGLHPGAHGLECKGFWCGCRFEATNDPVTKGKPPVDLRDKSLAEMVYKFDPNQPRDQDGKWTNGGAGQAIDSDLHAKLSGQLRDLAGQYGFGVDGIELSSGELDSRHLIALRFDEETGRATILVSKEYSTVEKIQNKINDSVSKWANSMESRNVDDAINHEYGHLLYFKAMGYQERAAIKEAYAISKKFGIGMSDLGMKNEREYFAELFLRFRRGEYVGDRDIQIALRPVYVKLSSYGRTT